MNIFEEIYVKYLKGFEKPGNKEVAYKLKKTLYGLKQASRSWYSNVYKSLILLKFIKSKFESLVFFNYTKKSHILVGFYVDDLQVTKNNEERIENSSIT